MKRSTAVEVMYWGTWLAVLIALIVLCFSNKAPAQSDPSVVRIRWHERGSNASYIVSGTIIERRGKCAYVLSCWHGMRDAERPQVLIGAQPYQADVKDFDTLQDLVILEIADPGIRHALIAETAPRIGECVWIAGHGQGTYRKAGGRVTQFLWPDPPTNCPIHRSTKTAGAGQATFLECRASPRGGDSGGPIINGQGRVVGVICGGESGKACGPCLPRLRGFLGRIPSMPARTYPTPPAVRIPLDQVPRIPTPRGGEYPEGDPRVYQVPAGPPTPPPTSDRVTAEIAALRADIASLREQIAALTLKPGPPGRDGKDGLDGKPGAAAEVNIDEIVQRVRDSFSYDIVPKK